MDLLGALIGVSFILLVVLLNRLRSKPAPAKGTKATAPQIGDITTETLQMYCGYDYTKPILVAIRGVVYDVTSQGQQYGPGKPLHVYAGKEIARALALESVKPEDVGSADVSDLSPEQLEELEATVQEMKKRGAERVGQVVALKDVTLEELAQHDGRSPELPLYLSIQGTVYNVTSGSQFYGLEGVYPFAGRECARALALMSTELSDCNADLEGLSYTELETLRDWRARFNSKYPIVGKLAP